jgi:6-pyruvoyltetrahydropterin/6-carboxytetrahydropterin synthase
MITVTKVMTTETAHRLINYEGKCAHIHGHSYRWEVTAARDLNGVAENGIAVDFSELKAAMRECIFERYDHALVLADQDPLSLSLGQDGKGLGLATDNSPQKIVIFPINPTAELFAKMAAEDMQQELNRDRYQYKVLKVRVWETANSYGEWIREK